MMRNLTSCSGDQTKCINKQALCHISSYIHIYKLRVTLFVRDGLLNYLTDFNQILHTGAVWSNLKDRVVLFFVFFLGQRGNRQNDDSLPRCAKRKQKTVSDFYWLKTPAAPSIVRNPIA